MALRAGYYGIKNKLLKQLINIPAQIMGKADASLLATVQTELTADKAYEVGEQFIYNQLLYKVTQPIASGAAITIGTNAVLAGSITSQLNDVSSGTIYEGIVYTRVGRVVTVTVSNQFIGEATLPADIRPTQTVRTIVASGTSGGETRLALMTLGSAGEFFMSGLGGQVPSGTKFFGGITYVI